MWTCVDKNKGMVVIEGGRYGYRAANIRKYLETKF